MIAFQTKYRGKEYLERLDDAGLFCDYLRRRMHVPCIYDSFGDEFDRCEITQIVNEDR
jgi:hypothetical protein